MAGRVIDIRDDARLKMQMAKDIGAGIGGYFKRQRQKDKLAEERERRELLQKATIRELNSGATGQELHSRLYGIKGFVESEMGQRTLHRQIEQRLGGKTAIDENVKMLGDLTRQYQSLFQWDGVQQQFVQKPESGVLKQGIETAIKNTVARITAAEQARGMGVEDVAGAARKQLGTGQTPSRAALGIDDKVSPLDDQLKAPETDVPARYGTRNDGVTQKGDGFFGPLKLLGGGVATEYTTQSDAVKVDGQRIDFPSLVPTLTKEEVFEMIDDIIPNRKNIPESIMRKAIDHANQRISQNKSVFADEGEQDDFRERIRSGKKKVAGTAETPTLDSIVAGAHEQVQATLPKPTTQEEYDAIPKGAAFIDTDGIEKRKQ